MCVCVYVETVKWFWIIFRIAVAAQRDKHQTTDINRRILYKLTQASGQNREAHLVSNIPTTNFLQSAPLHQA